jgi:hypothetical protein
MVCPVSPELGPGFFFVFVTLLFSEELSGSQGQDPGYFCEDASLDI